MPRKRDPANERSRADMERWREKRRAAGGSEVDLVDTSLSIAVAVYVDAALRSGKERSIERVQALEAMAANYLIARGKSPCLALVDVQRRTRRLDVHKLAKLVKLTSSPPAVASIDPIPKTS